MTTPVTAVTLITRDENGNQIAVVESIVTDVTGDFDGISVRQYLAMYQAMETKFEFDGRLTRQVRNAIRSAYGLPLLHMTIATTEAERRNLQKRPRAAK